MTMYTAPSDLDYYAYLSGHDGEPEPEETETPVSETELEELEPLWAAADEAAGLSEQAPMSGLGRALFNLALRDVMTELRASTQHPASSTLPEVA